MNCVFWSLYYHRPEYIIVDGNISFSKMTNTCTGTLAVQYKHAASDSINNNNNDSKNNNLLRTRNP